MYLGFAFVVLSISNNFGSGAGLCVSSGDSSDVDSDAEVLSRFFNGNTLLLKILGVCPLKLRNNHLFFRQDLFSLVFYLYSYSLIHWLTDFAAHEHLLMRNISCVYLLEKQ